MLRPGDLQWMTAGRGVVHSEMPGEAMTRGLQVRISTYLGIATPYLHYLQLWVNLAAAHKMVEPSYQELPASRVPEAEAGGARVRVIAGSSLGVTSPVLTRWRL